MSVRNAIVLFLALSTMSPLVGCGSSSNSATPPPTGGFTTSSLSGTYVFSFAGTDTTPVQGAADQSSFAAAGTLVASSGSFSSGSVIDINDPALAAAAGANSSTQPSLPATGSYSITADGRGSGTLNVTINNVPVQIGIDFVLSSTSTGLITRFDGNGSGSGSINLQTAGITQANLQGSYAFGLAGADGDGNPLGAVGAVNLDGNGNVLAGSGSQVDFNDFGSSTNITALALGGAVLAGSPGTASLTTSATGFRTLGFDVWVIDSTHLKLIEMDSTGNILAGDAFVSTGQTAFPGPGPLVFTMLGEDVEGGPVALGGLLSSDGESLITGGLQDVNDEGTVAEAPSINGNFASNGARSTLTLDGIYNGGISGSNIVPGTYTFAAYPYTGGIELLEIDNAGITAGAAYSQSPSSLAASQGYALNLSGAYGTENEEDETEWLETDIIAQFSTNSSGISSGLYDANNLETGLISDLSLGASSAAYSNDSNGDGRGTASFPNLQTNSNSSVISALDFTFYTINSSSIVFIETDNGQVATGTLQLQSGSGSSGAIRPALSMVRPGLRAHGALQKKKK
jgi:hypothetical protein